MADQIVGVTRFNGGIADSVKEGIRSAFSFAQAIDIHSEPSSFSPLPKSVLQPGSEDIGSVKWITCGVPYVQKMFALTEGGKLYESAIDSGSWVFLGTIPSNSGQGLEMFSDYLYYQSGTSLGRYGPLSGTPSFNNAFQSGLQDTLSIGYAPIKAFKTGVIVGHKNYVGYWDGSTWEAQKLKLPDSLWARSMALTSDYVAIGCSRLPVQQSAGGYVVLWDALSKFPNEFLAVDDGAVNIVSDIEGQLVTVAGTKGVISAGYRPFRSIANIPYVDQFSSVEVLPGAVCKWNQQTLIGVGGGVGDYYRGIYALASKSDKYPKVLSMDYVPSHGYTDSSSEVGSLFALGDRLYVGWKNGKKSGIDLVTASNGAADGAFWRSFIFDDSTPGKEKIGDLVGVNFLPLTSGQSVEIWGSVDRQEMSLMAYTNEVGQKRLRAPFMGFSQGSAFYEFQWEVRVTGMVTVTFTGLSYSDQRDSRAL